MINLLPCPIDAFIVSVRRGEIPKPLLEASQAGVASDIARAVVAKVTQEVCDPPRVIWTLFEHNVS
jgi:hypothetical protein